MTALGRVLVSSCFLLLTGFVACGWGGSQAVSDDFVQETPEPAPSWVYVPEATATPWPTFTPVPTVTPAPTANPVPTVGPTATLAPTVTPTLVPTAEPTEVLATTEVIVVAEAGVAETAEPTAGLTPGPTPYGKIWSDDFFFWQQSLFPLQTGDTPSYLANREWDKLPRPVGFVSRLTKFVVWVVIFDGSRASDDFVMKGFVRWSETPDDRDSLIMLESPVTLSKEDPFFYTGLGTHTPGFWKIGKYRIELLDDRYKPVVGWTFEVR